MKRLISVALVALFLASGLAFAGQKGKICVATKEKRSEAAVSELAAQAPYFLIFDEKGQLVETIDNPFKGKNEAGKLMLGFLVEKGVTAIIGRDYCGDIIGMLKNKGITAYNFEGSAAEAAAKVAEGQVPEALKENALVANHKAVVASQEKIIIAANGETTAAAVSTQTSGRSQPCGEKSGNNRSCRERRNSRGFGKRPGTRGPLFSDLQQSRKANRQACQSC
jgi:predicted Fe-Mo cluster-binding NifX family protein